MTEAIDLVGDWMDQPNVTFLPPGPRHVDLALGLLGGMGTAKDLTTDVQLGALAIEYDATVYSHDSDFGRFPEVRWVDPLR